MGYICINCGADSVMNIDTRNSKSKPLRRRKHCLNCDTRFTTYEIPVTEYESLIEQGERFKKVLELVEIVTGEGEDDRQGKDKNIKDRAV